MSRIISQKDWRALLKLNIYSLSKQSKDAVPRRLTLLLWLYSQLGLITNSAQEAQPVNSMLITGTITAKQKVRQKVPGLYAVCR